MHLVTWDLSESTLPYAQCFNVVIRSFLFKNRNRTAFLMIVPDPMCHATVTYKRVTLIFYSNSCSKFTCFAAHSVLICGTIVPILEVS